MENPQDDASIEALAGTATDVVELTLRLVNKYEVNRLDFLAPAADLRTSSRYFRNNDYDHVVFGEFTVDELGQYTFVMSGWNRVNDCVEVRIEQYAESAFEIFDVLDKLKVDFIEQLSGEHIGFGSIKFINQGIEGNYSVYVDGHLLGKQLKESDVLFGNRSFKITRPGVMGDEIVFEEVMIVEEGGEHSLIFSLEAGGGAALSSTEQVETALGNLILETKPLGAEISLNDKTAGFSPLILYGLGEGLYNLTATAEYYQPLNQVITIEPNVDNSFRFDLQIDPEHPRVAAGLKNPGAVQAWSSILSVVQVGYMMGYKMFVAPGYLENISMIDLIFMVPKIGHLLAGDYVIGTILTLISLVGWMDFAGIYYPDQVKDFRSSDASVSRQFVLGIAGLGSIFYDLIGSVFAARRWNEDYLARLQETGFIDKIVINEKPFGFVIQTGNGGFGWVGISWNGLDGWVTLEPLLGVSLDRAEVSDRLLLSLKGKVLINLLPQVFDVTGVYGGLSVLGASDFSSIETGIGGILGLRVKLPWFTFFLEGETPITSIDRSSLGMGVRI